MKLYALLAAGLLTAGVVFFHEVRVVLADQAIDDQTVDVLSASNRVLHDLENSETGQRGYLLTGDLVYLKPYLQGTQDLDAAILQLKDALGSDARSLELLRQIAQTKSDKLAELARSIEMARTGNPSVAIAQIYTNRGEQDMDALREEFGQLMNDWRERRLNAMRDSRTRLAFGSAALIIISLLVCCLLLYTLFIQRRAFARVRADAATLDHAATHDALTDLPNRRKLLSAIDACINLVQRPGQRIAVFYLDIDGFKGINDSLGHAAGDRLLCKVSEALRIVVRQDDMLARVGGDEFVLLALNGGDDGQLAEIAMRLIACVQAVGEKEFAARLPIGASVGVATYPDRVGSFGELLDVADAAMYAAKRSGPSTYSFGTSSERRSTSLLSMVH